MDTVVGVNAGKACATCDVPPSCTHRYMLTDDCNIYINFPSISKMFEVVSIISETKSYTFMSSFTPTNCINNKKNCPTTYIFRKGGTENIELTPNNPKKSYTITNDQAKLPIFTTPWEWLKEFFARDVNEIDKVTYYSQTVDCSGLVQKTQIDVYPKYILSGELKIDVKHAAHSTFKAKRSDYNKDQFDQLKNELGKTKWSEIGRYVHEKEYTATGKTELQLFDKKNNSDFTIFEGKKNIWKDKKSLVEKVKDAVEKAGTRILANKGGMAGIKEINLLGPSVEISGNKELKIINSIPSFEYNCKLKLAPLLGLEVRLDIINVLIAILGSPVAGKKWHDLRKLMEEQKDKMDETIKNGKTTGYTLFYIDFIISGEILNGGVTITKKNNHVKLIGEIENKLPLELKAGFEAGFRVLYVKGILTTTGGGKTALSAGLKCDDSGLGIYFSHEGIKAYFEVEVKAGYIQKESKSVSNTKGRSKNSGINLIKADVMICDKDEFGPFYFIDFK
ncbi:hypothetical protein [Photorhabdus heterorhabditis]|uniref:hypothetical protein n=1 Tax=Photorhabdus heterorhabditis TaxID=880156 RepID=UPI0015626E52|nr:hypothetical protein [Photorhabdus heterorhabditis]NRN30840.1 hypothetical protein [Photorhabdus heterorhabditis subsp. aluminescens]